MIFKLEKKTACINDHCFNLEIARTLEEKKKGLSFRDNLDQNAGMLFIYQKEGIYSFWMKDMSFPLDIIWIDKDQKIVHIERNVQPCQETCQKLKSKEKAIYVLEINSGKDFKVGDLVELK